MNIKRALKRVKEEIRATNLIIKNTSFFEGINTFFAKIDIQRMARNGYKESKRAKRRLLKKHQTMIKFFEKTYGDYLKNFNFNKEIAEGNREFSNNIWICWWQGIEKAPDVVKACVNSIKKNAGCHNVVIITDENYKEYVDIPFWIEEKVQSGIISRTNLSDLLRFSLLAKHGGLWLDSTFFATNDLSYCFEKQVWSIKRPNYLHCSVACGMFAGYSLCCNYESRFIFEYARELFLHYWENNDFLVDYLLVDYMISLVLKNSTKSADLFLSIAPNNPRCDDLIKIINQKYEKSVWEELTKETNLFKLSWKQDFLLNQTYFEKIIKENL